MEFLNAVRPARAPRAAILCLLLLPVLAPHGAAAPVSEYQAKAVFLFNFATFVDWDPSSFPNAASPFVIGILGPDPFGSYLDDVVRGERVGNRPVEVRRFRNAAELGACHLLFISRGEPLRIDQLSPALRARGVLTVGETADFAKRGGIIELSLKSGKIRLLINVGAARASSLTISSKLLRNAQIIESGRP